MRFIDTLKTATGDLWDQIHTMPFNRELSAGTLPAEIFKGYIIQDAHYLEGFARALALAAARAPNPSAVGQLAGAASGAVMVEAALHTTYMEQFGVSKAEFTRTPKSQACDHYVSALISSAATDDFPVAVCALLPCFWVYYSVGQLLAKESVANNPYQAWIDTYSGEEFASAVEAMLTLTDGLAAKADQATQEKMTQAFIKATWHEWHFWHSAYHQEGWLDVSA
jgi:thiaminase/transcriptional activator TenA